MTERAQPGAIKSLVRNDELAQILGQLTGGFDDGWVADPADPTPASTRRNDIDESAFDGFALSNVSASSLSVDVGPGEAFAGGWLAIDTTTTVTVPANTTSTIVAAMDIDAVFDPNVDPDRDAADRVVIDIEANIAGDLPRVQLHNVTTDGSGVTGTTDLRKPYGPALEAASGTVEDLEAASGTVEDLEAASGTVEDLEAGGADIANDWVNKTESGPVAVGNAAVIAKREVADGETFYITQAALTVGDGTAVPSGFNLQIATLDGSGGGTQRVTVLSGDGTTILDDETGNPLASWTNNTGSSQQTAILMDNGQFSAAATDEVDGYAEVTGRVAQ